MKAPKCSIDFLGRGGILRAFALAVVMIAGSEIGSAQVEMCADPMTFCAAKLPPDCAVKLSAGSIASADRSAECRDALDAYSGCISLVASECVSDGSASAAVAIPTPSSLFPKEIVSAGPFTLRCEVTEFDPWFAPNAEKEEKARSAFPAPVESTIDPERLTSNVYLWSAAIFGDGYGDEDAIAIGGRNEK